ncbi:putative cytochrome c [Thiomonas sp. X19]|jgi:cytochrome c5|uniref:cytochrome c n=1 Tax=Thiomonas sp. X19 TaxID=1050370 RepID=UPI000B6FBA8C|nr:cytochrome c [Thiomonas sp. X19]SCC94542.1 putative cytochrome c [Thiomonas sp. X19]
MKTHQSIFAFGVVTTAAFGLAALLASSPAQAITLQTKSINLPTSTRVFPGDSAGAKAANSYCLMCHSVGMVMNQPDLGKAAWLVEVNKMKNAFKAPIPEDQVAVIAGYLDSIKGKK